MLGTFENGTLIKRCCYISGVAILKLELFLIPFIHLTIQLMQPFSRNGSI